jgi:hypothetical protein
MSKTDLDALCLEMVEALLAAKRFVPLTDEKKKIQDLVDRYHALHGADRRG